jgi:hypothetical protein
MTTDPIRTFETFSFLRALALVGPFVLLLFSCAPEARDASCRIDADCTAREGKYRYCMMKKCVECVGATTCGSGKTCREGVCEPT